MTRGYKRPFHFKNRIPADPAVKRMGDWPECNREFYQQFYFWLGAGGYQRRTQTGYGVAARIALGLLDKPYWQIDEADLARVREHLKARTTNVHVRGVYRNGLDKFEQYLRQRRGEPAPASARRQVLQINWAYYVKSLPDWLADDVRLYLAHCRKNWMPSEQHQRSQETLSKLTTVLRWMVTHSTLMAIGDITPNLWEDHLAARLAAEIGTVTLNSDLHALQSFLRFLAEAGRPVCGRMLRLKLLPKAYPIPRDVPPEQLRRLLQEVERTTQSAQPTPRSLALMDRAWILLMLHSGLRTGEVRRLRLSDMDWERRWLRIEQSKGLKDRLVPLSPTALDALRAYLAEHRRKETGSDFVFVHWHKALNAQYCQSRLKWYGGRCGVKVSPHQLRHSAATLLLNAGAPVATVKLILGHQKIDTTLGYAHLYDGSVAADYYRAMAQVEQHLKLSGSAAGSPPSHGELMALVDSLRASMVTEAQVETLHALRFGILALAEQAAEPL
jgi:integrase/recombinase XerD